MRQNLPNNGNSCIAGNCPDDTGAGDINIAVPGHDADLALHIGIGEEGYMFPIRFRAGN